MRMHHHSLNYTINIFFTPDFNVDIKIKPRWFDILIKTLNQYNEKIIFNTFIDLVVCV